jgi:hypothetical protein
VTAWLLVVLVFAILYVFWIVCQFVFDLIEQASADRRSREAMKANREREQSDLR